MQRGGILKLDFVNYQTLVETYSNIQIVNLLSLSNVSPEYELNMRYQQAVKSLTEFAKQIRFHSFDFHALVKRDQYDKARFFIYTARNPF